MKILQVVCYFYPAWAYGGPPRNVYGLCKELVKRGNEITVFTTDAFDADHRMKETHEVVDGIEIRRFRNISNYAAFHHRLFLTPTMIPAMRDNIRKYDIVHLNDYRTPQNLLVHHYAKKYNIPYILEARGSIVNIISKQGLKRLYDNIGGYKLLRDASRLIAKAPLEIENYTDMGVSADKCDIIPNGLDFTQFENLPQRGEFRRKHGLKDNDLVILFLARLHKIKGTDLLISAFAGVAKEFSNAKLVVAGPDDGFLPELKKLTKDLGLEDRVLFVGGLYGEEKLSAYVDCDIYSLTSFFEIFGVSILEALACGAPVVLSDHCAISYVIKDKAGLVSPYEKEPLTKALCTLLADEKLRKKFSQNGKALVREQFSWTNIAKQMEQVYQKALLKK
jgi:glycosyltransferase involved in cell wall biosynthesis